ncbi:MAG: hypothetical protein ACQGVK_09195 [Myxococcota bacterium]
MTRERLLRWLEADRDGELHGWRRRWLERALARSAELRAERDALAAIGEAVRAAEPEPPSPDLWDGIEAGLDAVDREWAAGRPVEARQRRAPAFWWPAGAALGAAALAGTLLWASRSESPPLPVETASGHVRSLDTAGRSVWVQESDRATIIWLVGDEAGPV